jgi:hypothetical protein
MMEKGENDGEKHPMRVRTDEGKNQVMELKVIYLVWLKLY